MGTLDRESISAPIAVVGAGGFLGVHAVRRLGELAPEVRCFSRRIPADRTVSGHAWFEGSISDRAALASAISGCEAVVHLAGASSPLSANQNMVAAAEQAIVESLRLFDACVEANVRRVIYVSSGGTVYGIPSVIPTPEDAPTNPISAYGAGKLAVEHYLEVMRRQHGLDYRVLRVSNAYGPLQDASRKQGVIASFVVRALQKQPLEIWGDGMVVRDYVFVEDVAGAITKSIVHTGETRIFNIGCGEGTSVLRIVELLSELIGRRLECLHRPTGPQDVPTSVLDCSRALAELRWAPRVSLVEGLRRTIDWHRAGI
jgi:UDP-glucose 4-epimerase